MGGVGAEGRVQGLELQRVQLVGSASKHEPTAGSPHGTASTPSLLALHNLAQHFTGQAVQHPAHHFTGHAGNNTTTRHWPTAHAQTRKNNRPALTGQVGVAAALEPDVGGALGLARGLVAGQQDLDDLQREGKAFACVFSACAISRARRDRRPTSRFACCKVRSPGQEGRCTSHLCTTMSTPIAVPCSPGQSP